MIDAYVFIATKVDPQRVAREITNFETVVNLHVLEPSDYDLVVYVRAPDLIKLREFSSKQLARVDGIRKSSTLICTYDEPIGTA